jgi:hypothetical protein
MPRLLVVLVSLATLAALAGCGDPDGPRIAALYRNHANALLHSKELTDYGLARINGTGTGTGTIREDRG